MYSRETEKWRQRERRRGLLGRLRQGTLFVLLLAVALWGFLTWRADRQTFAWERPVEVAVVVLVDEASEGSREERADTDRFVERFFSRAARPGDNLRGVEEWLRGEYSRHAGLEAGEAGEAQTVRFEVRGPLRLDTPPPLPPGDDDSFFERLGKTNRFLDYFEELAARDDLLLGRYDVTLFVYFYDLYDKARRQVFARRDSIASPRRRVGVVFAPLSHELRGYTCTLIAHELCHTFGATDKYRDGKSVHPEGFAEPERSPLYPQRKAEIMALGIPQAPGGKEGLVTSLGECVVGEATAREMNWRPSQPRD